MMLVRILVGMGAAAVGGALGGPPGAYAGWKLGGAAATGNLLHLLPGGSLASDGVELLASAGDLADAGITLGGLDPGERKHW